MKLTKKQTKKLIYKFEKRNWEIGPFIDIKKKYFKTPKKWAKYIYKTYFSKKTREQQEQDIITMIEYLKIKDIQE